jgi:hypothetical protein
VNDTSASNRPDGADVLADSAPDTRWLSYRELAEILAPMRVESVIRLVRRKKWIKRESNNGVRVAVPADALADMLAKRRDARSPARPGVLEDRPADIRAEMTRTVNALEAAVTSISGQLAALRSDQDRSERVGQSSWRPSEPTWNASEGDPTGRRPKPASYAPGRTMPRERSRASRPSGRPRTWHAPRHQPPPKRIGRVWWRRDLTRCSSAGCRRRSRSESPSACWRGLSWRGGGVVCRPGSITYS